MAAVLARLAEDEIATGSITAEFARASAKALGRRYGRSFRTPGAALRVALAALDLPPDGSVALSALAPAWVSSAIRDGGLEPTALDVAASQPVVGADAIIASGAVAAFVEDRLGYTTDPRPLREAGIAIVYDATELLPASGLDAYPSDYTMCVLEPDRSVTTGGGAVIAAATSTRQAALNAAAGAAPDAFALSDMNSALGISRLRSCAADEARTAELYAAFSDALAAGDHRAISGRADRAVPPVFGLFVQGSPKAVRDYCLKQGVRTELVFAEAPEIDVAAYPNAARWRSNTVRFPLYPTLSRAEQTTVQRVLATLP